MTHVIADRVYEIATTTGTGAFTVPGSAEAGFQALGAVLSNGDTTYGAISHQSQPEWEVALWTYNGSNIFTRTTVLASSNGGSPVNFSAGTKDVFTVQPAQRDNPRLFGLTDNRWIKTDGTAGNIQQTGVDHDDSDNVSGLGNVQFKNGSGLRAGTTAADTLLLQARDVDGTAWTTAIRLTSGDTPTFELASLDLDTNGRAILFDDNTGIKDDSGNELLIFQKTASAVSQLEITNAATGGAPSIAAAGDDTDIDLLFAGKGTGTPVVPNAGIGLRDSDSSHKLIVKTTSNLTSNRTLTLVPGDADRSLAISGNATIGLGPTRQVFTASGTWTKPAGGIKVCVRVLGGGGGGGGAGGYSEKLIDVTAISSETVTIGALGAGGVAGANNGSAGGTTSFGAHCQATGGAGGQGRSANSPILASIGGAAGVGSGGDIDGGGTPGNPNTGAAAEALSGTGGSLSPYGSGGAATNASGGVASAGSAATGRGSGGSGAMANATSDNAAGGNGTAGLVIVEEYYA